MIRNRCKFS